MEWKASHVRKALRLKGYTLVRLAVELSTTPWRVRYTLRTGADPKICEAISRIIQVPAWELWCERYPPQWRVGEPHP